MSMLGKHFYLSILYLLYLWLHSSGRCMIACFRDSADVGDGGAGIGPVTYTPFPDPPVSSPGIVNNNKDITNKQTNNHQTKYY